MKTGSLAGRRSRSQCASSFSYEWTSAGRLAVAAGPQNVPVFPYSTSEMDHARGLETSRNLAARLFDDLHTRRVNVRREYGNALARYRDDLPPRPGEGNFMLADAQARILRGMFGAHADTLSAPMASQLKVLLEHHIGLRNFYPEVERFVWRCTQRAARTAIAAGRRRWVRAHCAKRTPDVSPARCFVEPTRGRAAATGHRASSQRRSRARARHDPAAVGPTPANWSSRKSASFSNREFDQFALWGVSQRKDSPSGS